MRTLHTFIGRGVGSAKFYTVYIYTYEYHVWFASLLQIIQLKRVQSVTTVNIPRVCTITASFALVTSMAQLGLYYSSNLQQCHAASSTSQKRKIRVGVVSSSPSLISQSAYTYIPIIVVIVMLGEGE